MTTNKLLIVGPLPPPVGGTTRSFELFCDEIKRYPLEVEILDSSPRRLKQAMRWFTPSTWAQAWRVIWPFFPGLKGKDCVLIFPSHGLLVSLVPFLVCAAKIAGIISFTPDLSALGVYLQI